ncbi:hypothetical protein [Microbulbifer sp. TRSA005]|uniref:hypothetical protein n=1 Tax=Microbulbifer sp. TRSA005 TaxID=3243383 RepID=UPI004039EE72
MAALPLQEKGSRTKRGKGTKWMVVVDVEDIPLGSTVTSTSPEEVNLLHSLLDATYKNTKIQNLVYDKAVNSAPLCYGLARRKIDLICPHRKNRK